MTPQSPTSPKILIVDDYEMFRIQLRRSLGQLGYSAIDEAVDGRVAQQMLEEAVTASAPYGLMLLDINMPKVNGFDLLKFCRTDARFKTLPIVIISAEAESTYRDLALKAGANDYITKPISQPVLQEKLGKISSLLKKP